MLIVDKIIRAGVARNSQDCHAIKQYLVKIDFKFSRFLTCAIEVKGAGIGVDHAQEYRISI